MKAPRLAVERPWMCSSRNGLRFCGIIELEPTSVSATWSSAASSAVHTLRSRATRARLTPSVADAASRLSAKSLEATASTELVAAPVNPSSRAVRSESTGTDVPPIAPAPSGLTSSCRPASRRWP